MFRPKLCWCQEPPVSCKRLHCQSHLVCPAAQQRGAEAALQALQAHVSGSQGGAAAVALLRGTGTGVCRTFAAN